VLLHQEQLRVAVAVHVAVIVEVVLGQVRERGDREATAVDAPEVESVRRHLHHRGVDALRAHAAQRGLEVEALGRRVARALAHVAVAHLDGADQPDRAARRVQDRLGEIGGGGLAVGARDADEREIVARIAEEARGDRRERAPRVGHDHRARAAEVERVGQLLDEERRRAQVERGAQVGVAVGVGAAQREERVARRDRARVVDEAADHRVVAGRSRHAPRGRIVRGQGIEQRREAH
jgi:hypothetical protein